MHHFIFSTQDTWISSGSSKIDGTSFKNQNFGRDQILEIKKEFFNNSFDHQTRALINFEGTEFTDLKNEIQNQTIQNPKYYLKLFEANGNAEISKEYTLKSHYIFQSWDEGTGKFDDRPKNVNGCSWENRTNTIGNSATTWSFDSQSQVSFQDFHSYFSEADSTFQAISSSDFLSGSDGNGGVYVYGGGFEASQSFNLQSPDVTMDVTDITNRWVEDGLRNYGFLVKFEETQETDSITTGHLKFFSKDTHTIFSPRIEVRWDDSVFSSHNLSEITMSGLADNFLYMKGLRESYKVGERVKFRIGARKRYIQKTFTDSVQSVEDSIIPQGSGSYAIKDIATDEFIVPFDDSYTKLSCDEKGNYFIQWLDGFYPDRVYKILLKLKTNDGQEQTFDDDFEFIVKRS